MVVPSPKLILVSRHVSIPAPGLGPGLEEELDRKPGVEWVEFVSGSLERRDEKTASTAGSWQWSAAVIKAHLVQQGDGGGDRVEDKGG